MDGNGNIKELKAALGLSVSLIAGEHFFSAGMSSPWSVSKFAKTEQDQGEVWTLFWEAAAGSAVFAVAVGFLLGDGLAFLMSLAGAVVIIAWMYWDYKRAMAGTLFQGGTSA